MRRIFGLLLLILGIVATVNMVKNSGGKSDQETTQERGPFGTTGYGKGKVFGRYAAPIVLFVLGGWLLLAGGDSDTTPHREPRHTSTPPVAPSRRGSQNAFASNPARLKVNFARWAANHPGVPIVTGGFLLLGIILLFVKWPVGIVVLFSDAMVLWQNYREANQKFFGGDVCPGIVLSAASGLVAVHTDLACNSHTPHPTIKILKQPLHKMPQPAQDGMRVATVAFYYGNIHQAAWKNFDPEVINCVVDDEAESARVFASIPDAQWQALDEGLARIPEINPGLYRLWGNKLTADTAAAVPWLQRKSVRLGLIAFACFGLFIIAVQFIAARGRQQAEARAQLNQNQPGHNPALALPRRPDQESLDLAGQVLTFTNLMKEVFKDIQLVKADYSLLTYKLQGGEKSMPLALVPVEIQDELQIPTDWHGYRAAMNSALARRPSTTHRPATTNGAYQSGQKISARWAGSWINGTIIEPFARGRSYRVQLADPRFQHPLVISTNLLRPR